MCLLNCNTKKKEYKHLPCAERTIRNGIKSGDVKVNNNDRKSDIVLKINTTSGDISIN